MCSDYRHRGLDIGPALAQRSVFLFGPRQTREFLRLCFHILIDTMLGYELSSYTSTVERKARESRPRKVDGIDILPWREFLGRLWAGDIVAGG
ncbi:MAG TPA: hypothetical protein PK775_06860 [Rectinema sp.]|jgi:hypothetical protein|nr:hypothetical protein [Rectinema sp.]HRD17031.1 hypothetical protein [Methanothrix soehngenii]HPB61904.1 hypothetical protein [Rectinema sp.]HPG96311.1 hypothetical protein [Rectinema sp.]HPN92622.1 hypothetical protein [Rectinema sp.]